MYSLCVHPAQDDFEKSWRAPFFVEGEDGAGNNLEMCQ